jgi:hypothetical protein
MPIDFLLSIGGALENGGHRREALDVGRLSRRRYSCPKDVRGFKVNLAKPDKMREKPAAPGVTSPPYGLKASLFLTHLHAWLLGPGFAASEPESPPPFITRCVPLSTASIKESSTCLENACLLARCLKTCLVLCDFGP